MTQDDPLAKHRTEENERLSKVEDEFGWAVDIVEKRFREGIDGLLEPAFLKSRFQYSRTRHDPLYATILSSMEDEALQTAFQSFWQIGQTLATQSRFWLEDAVYALVVRQRIIRQNERAGREPSRRIPPELFPGAASDWPIICSKSMLIEGALENRNSIATLGESCLETGTARGAWRVEMNRAVLDAVDRIVGRQEREDVPSAKPFEQRIRDPEQQQRACHADEEHFSKIAEAFDGQAEIDTIALRANLVIVDPNKVEGTPSVTALRFVNPRMMISYKDRRAERANLLRLYGYLVQEKILTNPGTIRVALAEIVPRGNWQSFHRVLAADGIPEFSDHYPDYFSTNTYWTCERLWKFIGVPFDVVEIALRRVGRELGGKMRHGLQDLLPSSQPG